MTWIEIDRVARKRKEHTEVFILFFVYLERETEERKIKKKRRKERASREIKATSGLSGRLLNLSLNFFSSTSVGREQSLHSRVKTSVICVT